MESTALIDPKFGSYIYFHVKDTTTVERMTGKKKIPLKSPPPFLIEWIRVVTSKARGV
jgi:hypothetical protein